MPLRLDAATKWLRWRRRTVVVVERALEHQLHLRFVSSTVVVAFERRRNCCCGMYSSSPGEIKISSFAEEPTTMEEEDPEERGGWRHDPKPDPDPPAGVEAP